MINTPSEMVGTERKGIRGIEGRELRKMCTSHVERLNGTQRLFLKRLNRLTYCFSKKLRNLEAAFALFAA
jgi:IS1 family transposase